MSTIKYLTKDDFKLLSKRGKKFGFNRQVGKEVINSLSDTIRYPIAFNMLHEHIAGTLQNNPHVRVKIILDNNNNFCIMDMTQEDYAKLPSMYIETNQD